MSQSDELGAHKERVKLTAAKRMTCERKSRTNWFDQGGHNYALFRPKYPPELAAYLASISPGRARALDVGCGTGQLTVHLADHFGGVVGLDPSEDQLKTAQTRERVTYLCSPAEDIPLSDHSVDLIAAAQAAHWFDRLAFYSEARRLAVPDAVIALISYGVLHLDGNALNERFTRFYREEIGPYWPPERKLVDSGYADIEFPFQELHAPALSIEHDWKLEEFLGYVSTWSAVRRADEAGQSRILAAFVHEISELWGGHERSLRVTWPINMRIGQI